MCVTFTEKRCKCLGNQRGGMGVGLLVVILLAASGYIYASQHFVLTDNGLKIYPKQTLSFTDSYVDMSKMSISDLPKHQEMVMAMHRQGDLRYVPGGRAIEKMQRAGYSISRSINIVDKKYKISSSAKQLSRIGREKYSELNDKYDIEGKASTANEKVKKGAEKFNEWLKKQ